VFQFASHGELAQLPRVGLSVPSSSHAIANGLLPNQFNTRLVPPQLLQSCQLCTS